MTATPAAPAFRHRACRALLALLALTPLLSASPAAAASGMRPRSEKRSDQRYHQLPLWRAFGSARSSGPVIEVPLAAGFACEERYAAAVSVHVVVPTRTRASYGLLQHLGMLGLTGADFLFYLREDPGDAYQLRVKLPCDMTFREHLLLPNIAEEAAALFTHVALHYDRLPDALVLLHGGRLQTWHNQCAVAIRRLRAFYRGLGNNERATPAMRAFASRAQTLNACFRSGVHKDCCGALLCRDYDGVPGSVPFDADICPWEQAGTALVEVEGLGSVTQALCQLRDRTAASNWTVLGMDVPEFFLNQRAILEKYARHPELLRPITAAEVGGRRRQLSAEALQPGVRVAAAEGRRLVDVDAAIEAEAVADDDGVPPGGRSAGGRGMGWGRRLAAPTAWHPEASAAELQSDAGPGEGATADAAGGHTNGGDEAARRRRSESAASAHAPKPGGDPLEGRLPLENAKDVLFPNNRERDLEPYVPQNGQSGHNIAIYDPGRFWKILLMAHGWLDEANTPPKDGERERRWTALQFATPRHLLARVPKALWEDAAFMLTNLAWRPRHEWPQVWGMAIESRWWSFFGQRYTTLADNQVFVDIERELGEDPGLLLCGEE